MLKARIMPTLLYKDTTLVKGVNFNSWRRVGSLMQAVKVYNLRQVDELVFLDITATPQGRRPDFALVDEFADECFMPLTVGGGIGSLEDVKELLAVGADKIAINSAAVENPGFISEAAGRFGSQCVVVSIDYRRNERGEPRVVIRSGTRETDLAPVAFAATAERLGAGEILLTSIDHDGAMRGYDLETIEAVTRTVKIPVIASGGAGSYEDMYQAFSRTGISAAAAASIFHFTQQTPLEAKKYLRERGIPTRL